MTAASACPLHILTLATLFPNAAQPNFGIFVERQTAELARRGGVAVTVLNPIGLPPWPLNRRAPYAALAELPSHEQWRELNVHRPRFTLIPKIGGARNPAAIVRALLPLVQQIHAQQPIDLIDAEFFYPDGPAAMHLAKAIGVPFTIKARGADIHYWGAQRGCAKQILAAAQAASGLLAVSAALRGDMAALGIDANKIKVHYTGLDQSRFRPSDQSALKAELGIDGPLLISHGALIARKNQALTIAALPELPDVQLLLAGSGPEEANYRALAAQLGVVKRVHFLGNVPHDDLPRYLAAADISVLVSQSEGLANAWVEALACGTPVIISAAGGARELLTDPVTGRIVEPSSSAIVAAVRAILADPPAPEAVAATVRHFSWQANGDQLFSFFREICSRTARPT